MPVIDVLVQDTTGAAANIDAAALKINHVQLLAAQQPAIASVAAGVVPNVSAGAGDMVTKVNAILAALRAHGLIAP